YQPYWSRLRRLDYPFLRDAADTAVATALRFTLGVPGVHTAIVGTTKPERWQQNAALLQTGPLPRDEVERIRARWREVADASWGASEPAARGATRRPTSRAPSPTTITSSPATTCSARRMRSTISPWRHSTARSPR